MFAYCNNNPVKLFDNTGNLAFPGEIHNIVVNRYAVLFGLNKEQRIIYGSPFGFDVDIPKRSFKKGSFGRADLISNDGQVWEVKRDNPSQIKQGAEQIRKYTGENSIWYNNPETSLTPGEELPSLDFIYKSGLTTYRIQAHYVGLNGLGSGVIAYDYETIDFDWETVQAGAQAVFYVAALFCSFGAAMEILPPPVFGN